MKESYEFRKSCLVFLTAMLVFSISGCSSGSGNSSDEIQVQSYPIDSTVVTTAVRKIVPASTFTGTIQPQESSHVWDYTKYGYGAYSFDGSLVVEKRADIMPEEYVFPDGPYKDKFINFFAITDIHITDKESPAQLIYLQQLYYPTIQAPPYNVFGHYPWTWESSVYSPVMLYTTQVLDAAIQTINALNKQPGNAFDFGLSLGDVTDKTQYNELRWYLDVIDGKVITPSSGAHLGADTIDFQQPFQAAGLDKTIPFYQTLGNHDHFFIGSLPVGEFLRQAFISDTVIAMGDVLLDPTNVNIPQFYMGVLDGSSPYGEIINEGHVVNFSSPPKVVPDPDRRSLLRTEWISEFFNTTSNPVGHGFNLVDPNAPSGFACYSFVPKSDIPIKIIVLDDTQREDDADTDIHGHGFLDPDRWAWLQNELDDGDAAGQLMIIAAHIPIGVSTIGSKTEWWDNSATNPLGQGHQYGTQNAVTLNGLMTELQGHPNLLMWISGHLHQNTVNAFVSTDSAHPEQGFWEVQTSSLRDSPQQFRTFEIYLNSDYTISIVITDVDPAVGTGTPAATSRGYAIGDLQICGNPSIYQQNPVLIDFLTQEATATPNTTIHPMYPTGSYNAELFKQLSPQMITKLQALFP